MRSCSTSQTTRMTARPSNYCATMVGTRARLSYYIRARASRSYWTQVSRLHYDVYGMVADGRCRLGLSIRTQDTVEGRERNVSIHPLLHPLSIITDALHIVLRLLPEHERGEISTAVFRNSSLAARIPCRKRRPTHGGQYMASPSIGYGGICDFACGMTRSIGSGTHTIFLTSLLLFIRSFYVRESYIYRIYQGDALVSVTRTYELPPVRTARYARDPH